jgi:hypothetical protein
MDFGISTLLAVAGIDNIERRAGLIETTDKGLVASSTAENATFVIDVVQPFHITIDAHRQINLTTQIERFDVLRNIFHEESSSFISAFLVMLNQSIAELSHRQFDSRGIPRTSHSSYPHQSEPEHSVSSPAKIS